jgi:hypothetical protein
VEGLRSQRRSRRDTPSSAIPRRGRVISCNRSGEVTAATTFTPGERDYVRREQDMFFSTYPTVAEGFQLKTWRGGPQAGQPKLPPPGRSLLDRGPKLAQHSLDSK